MFTNKNLKNNVLQVLIYFLFVSTLWITIERLLMWNVFDLFFNNQMHILLSFFGHPKAVVHLDQDGITIWLCGFVIIATTILLVIKNRFFRYRDFWLTLLPFLALITITGMSGFWSVQSGYTISRFLLFSAVAMGGIIVSFNFRLSTIQWVLEAFAALVVLSNSLMHVLRPQFAITALHTWVGVFSWKMPAATLMGFAVIMFLFRIANFKNERWITRIYSFVFYLAAWFFLVKSRSMTEVISALAAHGILVMGMLYLKWGRNLKPAHWWIIAEVVVFGLLALWFGREYWLGFFGRNSDFTGRVPIWASLIPYIQQRPILGYGFGEAFWKIPEYYEAIWLKLGATPVFAHNGYIEALLDTGITGLMIWLIFLVQVAYFSLRYFLNQKSLMTLILFAWFVFTIVANIANVHLGSYETCTWLLLVVAFFHPFKQMLEVRHPIIPASNPK